MTLGSARESAASTESGEVSVMDIYQQSWAFDVQLAAAPHPHPSSSENRASQIAARDQVCATMRWRRLVEQRRGGGVRAHGDAAMATLAAPLDQDGAVQLFLQDGQLRLRRQVCVGVGDAGPAGRDGEPNELPRAVAQVQVPTPA